MYKTLYSTTTEHILFKYTQNTQQHSLYSGLKKKSSDKLKNIIEIIKSIFSDYNGIGQEINSQKIPG